MHTCCFYVLDVGYILVPAVLFFLFTHVGLQITFFWALNCKSISFTHLFYPTNSVILDFSLDGVGMAPIKEVCLMHYLLTKVLQGPSWGLWWNWTRFQTPNYLEKIPASHTMLEIIFFQGNFFCSVNKNFSDDNFSRVIFYWLSTGSREVWVPHASYIWLHAGGSLT